MKGTSTTAGEKDLGMGDKGMSGTDATSGAGEKGLSGDDTTYGKELDKGTDGKSQLKSDLVGDKDPELAKTGEKAGTEAAGIGASKTGDKSD